MRTARRPRISGAAAAILLLLCLLGTSLSAQEVPGRGTIPTDRKDLGPKGEVIIDVFNVSEAPLQAVLRGIAAFSGLNIAIGPDVRGAVTVYFENVTVKDALETVLKLNDLSFIMQENIVVVLPSSKTGEDKAILEVAVITPQYITVDELATSLDNLVTTDGEITVNQQSNSVIVQDTPRGIAQIREILVAIDRPRPQVKVEAHLVEVTLNDSLDLGIDWSFLKAVDSGDSLSLNADSNLGRALSAPSNRLLSGGSLDFGYARGFGTVTAFLNALSQKTNVKVLANPNIIVLDNKTNVIEIQNLIPFVETNVSQGVITESVMFQETGLKLTVTPHITDDDHVVMNTEVVQRIPGPRITLGNTNAFDVQERRATNDLIVLSGQTVAVGGLVNTNLARSVDKVPFLGDMPLVGNLFKRRNVEEERTELMLFITPVVIRERQPLTARQSEALAEFGPALNDYDILREEAYGWQKEERAKREVKADRSRLREIEKREKEILKANDADREAAIRRADGDTGR